MELAFLLIVLVIAELILTVYLVSRHKMYLQRISDTEKRVVRLERNVKKLAEVCKDFAYGTEGNAALDGISDSDITQALENVTPEDIEKAQELLKGLGLGK